LNKNIKEISLIY